MNIENMISLNIVVMCAVVFKIIITHTIEPAHDGVSIMVNFVVTKRVRFLCYEANTAWTK